jgi:FMN hydrolase / 5-amino-6-(5-phospho-D-ribitylamino)uracil phosphatase
MRRSDVWTQVAVGTDVALARLRQSYALGMVSNADGKLELVLQRLGLARFFQCIVDSGNERFKKPESEIFLLALDKLGASPSESLYVGDIYSIDYKGAQDAGMQAVLLDRSGAYLETGLPRIDSLEALEGWIADRNLSGAG